jgi:hypothetical protein
LVERLARFDLGCLENPLFGEPACVPRSMAWPICCKRLPMSGQVSDRLACAICPCR